MLPDLSVAFHEIDTNPDYDAHQRLEEKNKLQTDFEGKAQDMDERERLVRDLGDKNYLVLRNHGLLVCAPTISRAFKEMYAMEKACKTQIQIMSTNAECEQLSENLLEFTAQQFANDATPSESRPDGFPSLKKMLDRINPGYDA